MATTTEPTASPVSHEAETSNDPRDDQDRYYLGLEVSREMDDRLEDLARRADVSKAEIINRAVGLYKVVMDSLREGKRVGILTDPEVEFDLELVES